MTTKQRTAFINWHDEMTNNNYTFNFKKELEEYCSSDVDILRRGCLEQFLAVCNIDPFKYITIASVCMAIYRQSDLSNSTIAVIKNVKKEKFSDESIKWLKSKILNGNKNIKYTLNGGEAVICGAKVDGYDVSEKKCISIMDVSGMAVRIASTRMIQTPLIKTP
ncbi:putative DNA polymerase [Aphis craccivora]|uniref:DNA-directed DNA polymerase n=1 Tax=Aphis craccivora TaxID=307492 RepID=A0A6G0WGX4_APHCR|nr:putative DNA polymerase [Aphis craccivora]